MIENLNMENLTKAAVAVGIMLLASKVLTAVLPVPDLRPVAMFLLLDLLAAVVYFFFLKK